MLQLNETQKQALSIWAHEKLLDILDGVLTYEGDDWIECDLPEFVGQFDLNIYDWEEEDGRGVIKMAVYPVVDGRTDGDSFWVIV